MSLTNIEQVMPVKLAQALANPLFPALDSQLRSGKHIGIDDLDNHAFLMDFESELAQFYSRYHVEMIRAPEGFFYLRPRSTTLIARSVLSELDMMVGKILCYLYLSPERLANAGIFTQEELYEELLSLSDESKLLRFVNQRSAGSDIDRAKLAEKVRASLTRMRRLGMVWFMGNDSSKFRITETVFRFGAEVRSGEDPQQAQLKLIKEGEAVSLVETAVPASDQESDGDSVGLAEDE